MVMAMATKEDEGGPPPKPEAFVAMQKYNEELVSTKSFPSGIILNAYKVAGPLKTG